MVDTLPDQRIGCIQVACCDIAAAACCGGASAVLVCQWCSCVPVVFLCASATDQLLSVIQEFFESFIGNFMKEDREAAVRQRPQTHCCCVLATKFLF